MYLACINMSSNWQPISEKLIQLSSQLELFFSFFNCWDLLWPLELQMFMCLLLVIGIHLTLPFPRCCFCSPVEQTIPQSLKCAFRKCLPNLSSHGVYNHAFIEVREWIFLFTSPDGPSGNASQKNTACSKIWLLYILCFKLII